MAVGVGLMAAEGAVVAHHGLGVGEEGHEAAGRQDGADAVEVVGEGVEVLGVVGQAEGADEVAGVEAGVVELFGGDVEAYEGDEHGRLYAVALQGAAGVGECVVEFAAEDKGSVVVRRDGQQAKEVELQSFVVILLFSQEGAGAGQVGTKAPQQGTGEEVYGVAAMAHVGVDVGRRKGGVETLLRGRYVGIDKHGGWGGLRFVRYVCSCAMRIVGVFGLIVFLHDVGAKISLLPELEKCVDAFFRTFFRRLCGRVAQWKLRRRPSGGLATGRGGGCDGQQVPERGFKGLITSLSCCAVSVLRLCCLCAAAARRQRTYFTILEEKN